MTLGDLCSAFLTYKHGLLQSEEITPKTFSEYEGATDRLVDFFGVNRSVDRP